MIKLFVIILTVVTLASCGEPRESRRAVQPLPSGEIIDLTVHVLYKKGDTLTVVDYVSGAKTQFKILE